MSTLTTLAYFTSPQDWMWIGLIVLVLFGGAKIPQLARGFGEGIREFKKSVNAEPVETSTHEVEAVAK